MTRQAGNQQPLVMVSGSTAPGMDGVLGPLKISAAADAKLLHMMELAVTVYSGSVRNLN